MSNQHSLKFTGIMQMMVHMFLRNIEYYIKLEEPLHIKALQMQLQAP